MHLLFHDWVQSSLRLSHWFVISFHNNFVHAIRWTNSFQVRYVPSNCSFMFLQNLHQLIFFCFLQRAANNHWFGVIVFQDTYFKCAGKVFNSTFGFSIFPLFFNSSNAVCPSEFSPAPSNSLIQVYTSCSSSLVKHST